MYAEKTPMARIIEAGNYSAKLDVQIRHALNDPYSSMLRQERASPSASIQERDYAVMYERERTKAQGRFETEYRADITGWNWSAAKAECISNAEYDDDACANVGRCFIGSILNTYPSGKIYAFWTSNQTDYDVMRDEIFSAVLEEIADAHGGWIDESDGDLFFCMACDGPDMEQ